MSGPINPRGGRYLPQTFGSIGAVRKDLLARSKEMLGELLLGAASGVRPDGPAPAAGTMPGVAGQIQPAAHFARDFTADWLDRAGSGFVDSANGIRMAEAPNGLMSLQVDDRILDMMDVATLGAMGLVRVGKGVVQGTAQAAREFAENIGRSQIVAGPKARTANLVKLKEAQELDQRFILGDGGTAEQRAKFLADKRKLIFQKTGWWQGKDGEWRFEIDDSSAKLRPEFEASGYTAHGKPMHSIVEHDALYDAYPEIMQARSGMVVMEPGWKRGGHFDPRDGSIHMQAGDADALRTGLLHELNHAVQNAEGFAPGGNPEYASELVRKRLENDPYLPEGQRLQPAEAERLAALSLDPRRAYRSLSGEVESRMVERRSAYSPERRRSRPPWMDFDTPESKQLLITGNRDAPVQLSMEPGDGRLPGLPDSVEVPGRGRVPVAPNDAIRRAALDFMEAQKLDPSLTVDEFRRVDPVRGKAIADAFDAMKNDPSHPVVRASYRALIDDVKGQFEALKNLGIKFEFIRPGMKDPYEASPRLAIEDLNQNKHLWVYPTDAGFGNADSAAQSATNPLLADTGIEIDGRKLVANDLFRIVHDVMGHAKEGVGFRADGEENAWLQHLFTFRPQSRLALTLETRGQNSWLNFGPHGEANRTASAADTVFAPQKVGDLPAWVMDPSGMPPAGPAKTAASLNIGLKVGENGRLDPDEALAALRGLGVDVTEHGIIPSATEDTLVAGLGRALSPAEAEQLARSLNQEAIAQKVGKKGALHGPGKDKWGEFSDEYFLQLRQLRAAAKKGQADPPLFDYARLEQDPGRRIDLPLYDPPRGTPEREARLLRSPNAFKRLVEFARKGMTNDGLGWYNTEQLREEFVREWGDEEGVRLYDQFIDLVGATSAGARTDANLKIASKYHADAVQGLPPTIPPKGSGYGHKAQNLHFENARDILSGKPLDPIEHPKRSRFAANLKGDWSHSTIDKHNVRAIAIASRDKEWVATKLEDTKGAGKPDFWNAKRYGEWNPATFNPREFVERTRMPFDKIPVTWFESAPKGTAYKALTQLNERLAAELGVTPAQAQAALWLGAGDATGLGSKPIALMKVLDQRLAITARQRKITKKEALRQMIRGENPLLGVAGAASLLPLLAEDGDGA